MKHTETVVQVARPAVSARRVETYKQGLVMLLETKRQVERAKQRFFKFGGNPAAVRLMTKDSAAKIASYSRCLAALKGQTDGE